VAYKDGEIWSLIRFKFCCLISGIRV